MDIADFQSVDSVDFETPIAVSPGTFFVAGKIYSGDSIADSFSAVVRVGKVFVGNELLEFIKQDRLDKYVPHPMETRQKLRASIEAFNRL